MPLAAALGALVAAVPAGAVVTRGPGDAWYGVEPLAGATVTPPGGPLGGPLTMVNGVEATGQAVWHGGPVLHGITTHAIFWDPGHTFLASTENLVTQYLSGVAANSGATSNVFSVAAQYTDGTGPAQYSQAFGGTLVDDDAYPPGECSAASATTTICLNNSQVVSEVESFVAGQHLPTGLGNVYIVFTPDTVATCMDGSDECSTNTYCSYHSAETDGSSTLLYIQMPFTLLDSASDAKACQEDGNSVAQEPNGDPGLGDIVLKSLTHEMIETITDPLADAWFTASGDEVADLCNGVSWNADSFLPLLGGNAADGTLYNQVIDGAHYYLQGIWSNEAAGCQLMSALEPSFTVPSTAAPGVSVTLDAVAGTGAPVADSAYAWSFGDGQTATGESVTHSYGTAGNYTVTLTVTDAYGNTGTASRTIAVATPGSAGKTAGASGTSGAKAGPSTTCHSVASGKAGVRERVCTTTTTSTEKQLRCKPAGTKGAKRTAEVCHTVRLIVTRSRVCRQTRANGAAKWAARCEPAKIVSSKLSG